MSQKFLISPLIIHCTGGPSQFNKPRKLKKKKEMKRLKIWKGIKMPLFANKQIKNEFGNSWMHST